MIKESNKFSKHADLTANEIDINDKEIENAKNNEKKHKHKDYINLKTPGK